MNLFHDIRLLVVHALDQMVAADQLPQGLSYANVTVEPPRDPLHGDMATNAAMVLAKPSGQSPRAIAEALAPLLRADPRITGADVAGPGFLNLSLCTSVWQGLVGQVLENGAAYGRSDLGNKRSVNVEFVSANPTSPLHVGHTRGAVFGDALANLLDYAGFDVTREYYINDGGAQVDVLARSTYLRYCEALGRDIGAIPAGLYPGLYLKDVGQALAARDGELYLDKPEAEWLEPVRSFAIDAIMQGIKTDLLALGIKMDQFSSERALVNSGAVGRAIDKLQQDGHLYQGVLQPPKGKEPEDWEPREQLLFKASEFGDDTDRPLQKSDGTWTYFAADVAYHLDKLERTGGALINIFGADHGGYVKRMTAAVAALSGMQNMLDIKLCQLVNLLDNGQPVKMSKRAGTFVTVEDVIEAVGADVIRFISNIWQCSSMNNT